MDYMMQSVRVGSLDNLKAVYQEPVRTVAGIHTCGEVQTRCTKTAIECKNIDVLQWIHHTLQHGMCSFPLNTGVRMIMYACSYQHMEVMQWLLSSGVGTPNIALKYATIFKHLESVQWLLRPSGGANIDSRVDGLPPLHVAAAVSRNSAIVEWMIVSGGADVHLCDSSGVTALLYIPVHELATLAPVFLDNGADVNAGNALGATILMAVAYIGDLATVSQLVTVYKADTSVLSHHNENVLFYAATNKQLYVVEWLLEYNKRASSLALMNVRNFRRWTRGSKVILLLHHYLCRVDKDLTYSFLNCVPSRGALSCIQRCARWLHTQQTNIYSYLPVRMHINLQSIVYGYTYTLVDAVNSDLLCLVRKK
jgi:ankyrin repeat protein